MAVRSQFTSIQLMFLLLCSALLATTLQGVQGEVDVEGPSESECRPYIEKALKKLETGDAQSAEVQDDIAHIVTTDDSETQGDSLEITDAETSKSAEEETQDIDAKSVEEEIGQSKEEAASAETGDTQEVSAEEKDVTEDSEAEGATEEVTDESAEKVQDEASAEKDTQETQSEEKQDDTTEQQSAEEATAEQASVEDTTAEPASKEEVDEGSVEQDESVEKDASVEEEDAEKVQSAEEEGSVEQVGSQEQADEPNAEESTEQTAEESAEQTAESAEQAEGSVEQKEESGEQKDESAEQTTETVESAEQAAESAEQVAESAEQAAESAEQAAESAEQAAESTEQAESAEQAAESAEQAEDSVEQKEESGEQKEESAEKEGETSQEQDASAEKQESVEQEAASVEQEAASVENEASAEATEEKESAEKKESGEQAAEVESAEKTESVEKAESGEDKVTDEASTEAEAEKESAEKEQADEAASTEEATESETTPEEDLTWEIEIPTDLRPRDHVNEILHLNDETSETDNLLLKAADGTLKELKRIYENAIQPLETLYKYRDLSNRHFGDPEIFSKPLVLFMGPWSGGKSSIINYLLDNEYTQNSLRTGAEPSPAYFNLLMWGEEPAVLDGTQLAADWTFSGLQKFGQGLEERLRGLKLPNKLLEKINIAEIPGILEVRKQVSRVFPFNDACQWFIDRADIIFLVYDPSKLDVGPETEAILDQLKGREYQTRIILNKADQVKPEELMRVQGALIWNISPLMSSAQPPVMYSTSLWSKPYEIGAPIRLLHAQERAFLRDLKNAIDKRIENKIASARRFAVRVRNHAKMVDCYLTTYYNHKSVFGNKKLVADQIIEHPQDYHIYEGLSTLTNISRYDLPDPDVYRDFFRLNPLYDFQQLSATCTYFRGCPINRLDIAIAYDLPELVGKYKKTVETIQAGSNTDSSTKS